MNTHVMPKASGSIKNKINLRRLLGILLLSSIITASLLLHDYLREIRAQPNYIYRSFKWSSGSKVVSYLRIAVDGNSPQNGVADHELWVLHVESLERRLLATIRGKTDSVRILGWEDEDRGILAEKDEAGVPELYHIPVTGERATKYELAIPGLKKILYDKGTIFTFQEDEEGRSKKIGYISSKDRSFSELLNFDLRESENLDLIAVKVSQAHDLFALGIYYAPVGDDGMTHLWICDLDARKLEKVELQSYGRYISFDWSPCEKLLAACVAEKKEQSPGGKDSQINYSISFQEMYSRGEIERLTTTEIEKSLELFWNTQNKLFLVMKDAVYLLFVSRDPVAKPLLKWDTIGYLPDEFSISPDGSKIVFHSMKIMSELKDDVFLVNVDGTNLKRLIQPEGRRSLEGTALYKFFSMIKKVLSDFYGNIKK